VRNLELSPAAAHELELLLNTLMHEQRLYTKNDLTLVDLAAALRISTHLASELLNAHLHTSFYEFLNRHRAEEAARLLRAGQGKLSVADIAYQAGFNNPNTFYREFKRAHGVTPAQFRKSDPGVLTRSQPPVERPAPTEALHR
jgi:AraC-like DNA-binding protein